MTNARRYGRLGMLAVGLGVGAAIASTPGIASAGTGADVANLFNFDPALSVEVTPIASPIDLDISLGGFQLLDLGDGTAVATSGMGDLAIAFGHDSTATAMGGFGDYATATSGATAIAGSDVAGATGNNFDFASAGGIGSTATAGLGSFDYASASSGSNTLAIDGASAVATGGMGDSASAVGQGVIAEAGGGTLANPANFDGADVLGSLTHPTTTLTEALANLGNSDNAFVFDPFGTVGSTADAGGALGNNFDLAGVFGDALHAMANTGSNITDLLPSLFADASVGVGVGVGAAATDISGFLTDIGSALLAF